MMQMRNQKKLTVSLIVILCSLLICYFPSFLFEESLADLVFGDLVFDQSQKSASQLKLRGIGYRISLVCIYFNCSCNFLIYCISNKKFKSSLMLLLGNRSRELNRLCCRVSSWCASASQWLRRRRSARAGTAVATRADEPVEMQRWTLAHVRLGGERRVSRQLREADNSLTGMQKNLLAAVGDDD